MVIMLIFWRNRQKSAQSIYDLSMKISELDNNLKSEDMIKSQVKDIVRRELDTAKSAARITSSSTDKEIPEVLKTIASVNGNAILLNHWHTFYSEVDLCYNGFYSKLVKSYPNMEEREIQLCCMTIAGMETSEIAAIWHLHSASVYKLRTSLRKRLGLTSDADIIKALQEL